MSTYTPNLNLKKPEPSENVDISDINGNMDIIDEAVTSKVNRTGDTMTGNLHHTVPNISDIYKITSISRSVNPSSQTWHCPIDIHGSDDRRLGMVEFTQETNGHRGIYLNLPVNRSGDTDTYGTGLGIFTDNNGGSWAIAPTVNASDNSDKIATTAHVKSMIEKGGGERYGWYKFNNGLRVTWGMAWFNSETQEQTIDFDGYTQVPAVMLTMFDYNSSNLWSYQTRLLWTSVSQARIKVQQANAGGAISSPCAVQYLVIGF